LLARRLKSSGILGPETVALNLFSAGRLLRSLEIFNDFSETCGATTLPVAAHASDEEAWAVVEQFRPNLIAGMPSRLVAFARWIKAEGRGPAFESVFFGGEFLHARKRALLAEAFGASRFGGIYGSAEMGIVAYHPDVPEPPTYRFPTDLIHVEIVDPDESGFGRIVATNRVRTRYPLLRYDTGDSGRVVGSDGDEVRIELRWRVADSFAIGDDYYHLSEFAPVLGRFVQSQVVIDFDEAAARDRIAFRLVADGPVNVADRRAVEAEIRRLLEADDRYYLTVVDFADGESLIRRPGTLKVPSVVDLRWKEGR
jgi:phenylacetate-CoA ligase